ncbi:MAG: glyceraldehyde-3-phosphate dehydrogenase [Candidatus Nitrosocaldaceae archaeon]|nr:MAG: glyceraldehyde-3-phosphate dehydrogenase [Candidatus Nitrosocaldaceae archaeon]
MVKVFINGFGTIGRRVAYAVANDKEFEFVGVAKYTPDERLKEAYEQGYDVYIPEDSIDKFKEKGYEFTGTVKEAIEKADFIIDAAKDGKGYENKMQYYLPLSKPAIFQGGEDRYGEKSVANIIHNSRVNYDKAINEKYVMQGSCNVTGLGRIMQPLIEHYNNIVRFDSIIIRRWADLEDSREVKDSIEWTRNPHHQDDVRDFIKEPPLYVDAYKVPSRMMHMHQLNVRFDGKAPSKDEIIDIFKDEFGVAILNSARGTADVRKKALEKRYPFGDTCMVHIHADVIRVQDDVLKIAYSDDQTGIVIPENHILLQGMVFKRSRDEALKRTDMIFDLSNRKKELMEEFS